jgi:hypothetical protein
VPTKQESCADANAPETPQPGIAGLLPGAKPPTGPSVAFDPESLQLVGEVFDAALLELAAVHPDRLKDDANSEVVLALTNYLLGAVHAGKRDREKLKMLALRQIGLR